MFNRTPTITFPKQKKALEGQPPAPPTDYAALATDLGKKAVIGAVIILGAYFAMDTVRQVTVNNIIPK